MIYVFGDIITDTSVGQVLSKAWALNRFVSAYLKAKHSGA